MDIFYFFKGIWAGISIDQMCIFALVLYCVNLTKQLNKLSYQYNQLDKLMMAISIVIHIKAGVKLTQNHRTGDYDIHNQMLDEPKK